MVLTSKKLAAQKGILSNPKINPSKEFPPKTAEWLMTFVFLMKLARSCQGQKIMLLLTQKPTKFYGRES
jgi:hypothetical protein